MTIEDIAKVCHEANKAYCEAIGDNSQVPWHKAPQWQRDSAVSGVQNLVDNPNAEPQDSHENWMKEKLAAGWQWGPLKNEATLEHPCLVPYHELPETQQRKDFLFSAVVWALTQELE